MLNIVEVTVTNFKSNFLNVDNIPQGTKVYILNLDNEQIGYATINENDKYHKISIYIVSEQQGNGYGTYLFREMLKKIEGEVILAVQINNYKMIRIIVGCGGKEMGRNGKEVFFQIPYKVD